MSVRACCCSGSPCTGNNCCTASLGDGNCGVVAKANYTVNIGTVTCDCWTWGEYTVDAPGWRYCAQPGNPCNQINDCPQQFLLVKDQCEAGDFFQHNIWLCNSGNDCADNTFGDDTWTWPKGSVTAAFPMNLVAGALDPSGQCCIVLPHESGTITYTNFTGATNSSAPNAVICFPSPANGPLDPPPYTPTPPFQYPVWVQAGFCACRDHPCIEWQPNDFMVEPMCTPCTGKWDVVTVAYFIRNEHDLNQHYCFSGCTPPGNSCYDPPVFGCWTWDTWTALVRYVRQPVCTEEGGREITGTYTFACAEVFMPTTRLYYQPGGSFGEITEMAGQGRALAYFNTTPPDANCGNPLNRCLWDFPFPRTCPGDFFVSGNKAKICAPDTKGYGWSFPPTITIT